MQNQEKNFKQFSVIPWKSNEKVALKYSRIKKLSLAKNAPLKCSEKSFRFLTESYNNGNDMR